MSKIGAITIERQYCSGGREIAKLAAERLGIEVYDKELAQLTADKLGVSIDEIVKYEETPANPFTSPMSFKTGADRKRNMNEIVFEVQAEIITKLVQKKPCVIVGRCADYILRNNVPTLSVFVYADAESRLQHAVECHDIPFDNAEQIMRKMDRKRAEYYKLNTRREWDSMLSYDMCINSARFGLESAADLIAGYVRTRE